MTIYCSESLHNGHANRKKFFTAVGIEPTILGLLASRILNQAHVRSPFSGFDLVPSIPTGVKLYCLACTVCSVIKNNSLDIATSNTTVIRLNEYLNERV